MLTIRTPIKGLEALVRTTLFHGELAPGVAKQIKEYRVEPVSSKDKRLLAILDDLIADGLVTVIPTIEALGKQITAVVEQQEAKIQQETEIQEAEIQPVAAEPAYCQLSK